MPREHSDARPSFTRPHAQPRPNVCGEPGRLSFDSCNDHRVGVLRFGLGIPPTRVSQRSRGRCARSARAHRSRYKARTHHGARRPTWRTRDTPSRSAPPGRPTASTTMIGEGEAAPSLSGVSPIASHPMKGERRSRLGSSVFGLTGSHGPNQEAVSDRIGRKSRKRIGMLFVAAGRPAVVKAPGAGNAPHPGRSAGDGFLRRTRIATGSGRCRALRPVPSGTGLRTPTSPPSRRSSLRRSCRRGPRRRP